MWDQAILNELCQRDKNIFRELQLIRTDKEIEDLIMEAVTFLTKNYEPEIIDHENREHFHLIIDFRKLVRQSTDLANIFTNKPLKGEITPEMGFLILSIATNELATNTTSFWIMRLKNLPSLFKKPIFSIRKDDINCLVTLEGMIASRTAVEGKEVVLEFECPSCGMTYLVEQPENSLKTPMMCKCGRKGKFKQIDGGKSQDYFMLTLQEPLDITETNKEDAQMFNDNLLHEPGTIRVLCADHITNKKIERKLSPGSRVEITGIIRKKMKDEKKPFFKFFLEANYVEVLDEDFEINWNKEDIKDFRKIAKDPNWLKTLRNSMFYDIVGHDEICESVILQMFGGVGKYDEIPKKRGFFHILLAGDPGGAKSSIMNIAAEFSPKVVKSVATHVSAVGLTGGMAKDPESQQLVVRAGAIVLANNGLLIIDEFDKMPEDTRESLHQPLSDGEVPFHKGGVSRMMIARTSVLASANPKFGKYSEYQKTYSQITISDTLATRFDLIYVIKSDHLSHDDKLSIARKIASRGSDYYEGNPNKQYDKHFIKKYITYAKRNIEPRIERKISDYIVEKYAEYDKVSTSAQEGQINPITPRIVEAIIRISEAVAKSRLHDEVKEEDVDIAFNKMLFCLRQFGLDPESNLEPGVLEFYESPKPDVKTKRGLIERIEAIVRDGTSKGRGPMLLDDIYSIMDSEGVESKDVDKALDKLKMMGDIFYPKRNMVMVIK